MWSSSLVAALERGELPPVGELAEALGHQRGLLADAVRIFGPGGGDAPGQVLEAVPRQVRRGEEGVAFRREHDGHRPAAAPRHDLDRAHVQRVEVGALLAVDLDADERRR